MRPYSEFRPTRLDTPGLGCEDQQDWLVCPCGTNRDADILTESNWAAQCKALDEIDPDGNDHEVCRFGHWGPGWFEIALVRPDSEAAKLAEQFENALADYPVLDDNDFSDRAFVAACEYYESMSLREKVELIQRYGENVFAARAESYSDFRDRASMAAQCVYDRAVSS